MKKILIYFYLAASENDRMYCARYATTASATELGHCLEKKIDIPHIVSLNSKATGSLYLKTQANPSVKTWPSRGSWCFLPIKPPEQSMKINGVR